MYSATWVTTISYSYGLCCARCELRYYLPIACKWLQLDCYLMPEAESCRKVLTFILSCAFSVFFRSTKPILVIHPSPPNQTTTQGSTRFTNLSSLLTDRCSSSIGRTARGEQKINLHRDCWFKGVVIHEIAHAIGFFHEQSRSDRDSYVKILYENIQKGEKRAL